MQEVHPFPSAPQWNQTERPEVLIGLMGEIKKQQHTWDPHMGSRAGAGLLRIKELSLYNISAPA